MSDTYQTSPKPLIRDRELRHQIDDCVTRALFDDTFASALLSDPTTVLGQSDCASQDYLSLRSITASTLRDFAAQAHALFWGSGASWATTVGLLADDDIGQLAWHDDDALHAGTSDVLLDSR
jgi:hypothetical protein